MIEMGVYANSRYLHTAMLTRRGHDRPTFEIRERFSFDEQTSDAYTWIDGDTLDGVAYKFYQNTALRWALLEANPQYRTEFDIKPGDIIMVPSFNEVVNIVNV